MNKEVPSTPYHVADRPKEVLKGSSRLDGRGYEVFRNVFMKPGTLSQAAGSAYAEFGNTKVMVGVYGPRESERREAFSTEGRLQCDVKIASYARRERKGFGQNDEERELSAQMQTALEAAVRLQTFPKANVDITALVLESGGADLAVCICAAGMALADAGIEMEDMVSACSVSRVDGHLLLDPTVDEACREDGSALLAMMPSANAVAQVVLRGQWSNAQASEVLQLCMGGCAQIDAYMRQCLRDTVS
ncbi:g3423 [Coccomyxa elongata]